MKKLSLLLALGASVGVVCAVNPHFEKVKTNISDKVYAAYSPEGPFLIQRGSNVIVKRSDGEFITSDYPHGPDLVAFSKDGKLVATAFGSQIVIWNTDTDEVVGALVPPHDKLSSLDFSPDGRRLLVVASDGTISIYDHSCASMEYSWIYDSALNAHFSPDGTYVVIVSSARTYIHEVASGNFVQMIPYCEHARFSKNSQLLCYSRRNIFREDIRLNRIINQFEFPEGLFAAWAVSPCGGLLATAVADGRVFIWNVQTGERVQALDANAGWAKSVAFGNDGLSLMIITENNRLQVWRCAQEAAGASSSQGPVQGVIDSISQLSIT
jgi:WD40 repeat protein